MVGSSKLESQGNKSRRKNDKGPQDMKIDYVNVTTDLSTRDIWVLISKGLTKSNVSSYIWKNISKYRIQAKGIERAVCIAKECIYTSLHLEIFWLAAAWVLLCLCWLAFEAFCWFALFFGQ